MPGSEREYEPLHSRKQKIREALQVEFPTLRLATRLGAGGAYPVGRKSRVRWLVRRFL